MRVFHLSTAPRNLFGGQQGFRRFQRRLLETLSRPPWATLIVQRQVRIGTRVEEGKDTVSTTEIGPRWLPAGLLRPRLVDELEVFRPDILLIWDVQAARMVPRHCRDEAKGFGGALAVVGILSGYHRLSDLRGCDWLICLSPDLRDYARDGGWPEEHLIALPPYVPAELEQPQVRPVKDLHALVVVCPPPQKQSDLQVVLDELTILPETRSWVVVPEEQIPDLRKAFDEDGGYEKVIFVPERKREAVLACADVVVVADTTDFLGLGVLEAWALNKTVVTIGGLGNGLYARDGISALVVQQDQIVEGLAPQVLRLLEDPFFADRLAAAGQRCYAQDFAPVHTLERWLAAFFRMSGRALEPLDGDDGEIATLETTNIVV